MIDLEKIKAGKTTQELINFGIINIDKPAGPTSFWVDTFILRKLEINKASHTGTLDPLVTGVLPILLSRACRLLGYFKDRKEYVGIMKVHKEIEEEKLKKEMKKFEGKIKQLPPVKSRVKREERIREVYSWDLLEYDKENKEALFKCEVEAGTYIRKLIHDLGLVIGGAHMAELRRTKAGIFSEEKIYTLYQFEEAVNEWKAGNDKKLREMIIPGEIIGNILGVVQVKKESLKRLYTGSPLFSSFLKDKKQIIKEKIAIFCGEKFIETARKVDEGDILARPEFVLN